MILGQFILGLMVVGAILAIIGVGADMLNDYSNSKVLNFISEMCMRVCFVLVIEALILTLIQIIYLS